MMGCETSDAQNTLARTHTHTHTQSFLKETWDKGGDS